MTNTNTRGGRMGKPCENATLLGFPLVTGVDLGESPDRTAITFRTLDDYRTWQVIGTGEAKIESDGSMTVSDIKLSELGRKLLKGWLAAEEASIHPLRERVRNFWAHVMRKGNQ